MYRLKVKGGSYTIPKESIKAFALYEALQRGIMYSDIHDDTTAIKYLNSIGVEVEEK